MTSSALPVFEAPVYPGTTVLAGAMAASQICQPRTALTVEDLPELATLTTADNEPDAPAFSP